MTESIGESNQSTVSETPRAEIEPYCCTAGKLTITIQLDPMKSDTQFSYWDGRNKDSILVALIGLPKSVGRDVEQTIHSDHRALWQTDFATPSLARH